MFLFLCLCLALPAIAHAEIYVKNKPGSALPAPLAAPETAPASPPAPATNAGPALSPEMQSFAENYYTNCMAKTNPMLDTDSQKKLCACSAGRLGDTMTLDEIKTMQENTSAGQLARNKMLLQVYTPCIQFPTYALVRSSCINNPQVKAMPGYETICTCVSEMMAVYVHDNAPATIETALRKNPANLDPLRAMLESEGFDQASNASLQACLQAR